MKQRLIRPGFEAIFALSLAAIFALPALVFGQHKNHRIEIRINNGDTIVNGKNIKELSAADREQALKDIEGFGKWNKMDTGKNAMFFERRMFGDNDTAGHRSFHFRYKGPNGKDSMMTFNYKMAPGREFRYEPRDFNVEPREFKFRNFDMPGMHGMAMMHRRNSQNFSYTNTGSDGIPTHINFSVSDASAEKTKKVTGVEKADLELKDLVIVPEFSSGKTMLSFSLPAKGAADVKLTDNEGKVIWSDKAAIGSFSKSFALPLNGVYLLEVKQGGKTALKRIIKEE